MEAVKQAGGGGGGSCRKLCGCGGGEYCVCGHVTRVGRPPVSERPGNLILAAICLCVYVCSLRGDVRGERRAGGFD